MELVKTTSETIANAVEWVEQTPPQASPIRTNIVEAVIKALSLGEVSEILASYKIRLLIYNALRRRTTSTYSPTAMLALGHLIYYWKR